MTEIDYKSAEFPSEEGETIRYGNVLVPDAASWAWCKMFNEAYGHSHWRTTIVADRYKRDRAGRPSLAKSAAPADNVYSTIVLDKVSSLADAVNGSVVGAVMLVDRDHPKGHVNTPYVVLRDVLQRVSGTRLTSGPDDEILVEAPLGKELHLYIDDRLR